MSQSDLEEQFRLALLEPEANESNFRTLLSEAKSHKQLLQQKLDNLLKNQELATTMSTTQSQIRMNVESEMCTEQLEQVLDTMQRKLLDKQHQINGVKELLITVNRQLEQVQSEYQVSDKCENQVETEIGKIKKLISLMKSIHKQQKLKIKDKQDAITQDLNALLKQYQDHAEQINGLKNEIKSQQQHIKELERQSQIKYRLLQEQGTVNQYANGLYLMNSMLLQSDPYQLLTYKIEERLQIAQHSRTASQHIFFTQQPEEPDDIVEEDTSELLRLVLEQNQNLQSFKLPVSLQNFTDIIVSKYREMKANLEWSRQAFNEANNKKLDLQNQLKRIQPFSYNDSQTGFIALSMRDNMNAKLITLNVLSTSIEPLLQQQQMLANTKIIQLTVHRLYTFISNHVQRIHRLLTNISLISELVPQHIIQQMIQLKITLEPNDNSKTPSSKKAGTTGIWDLKRNTRHSMMSSMRIPDSSSKKIIHDYKDLIINSVHGLSNDNVERIFINQDMLKQYYEDCQVAVSQADDNQEAIRIIHQQESIFKFLIRQRISLQIKNSLHNMADIYNEIRHESLLLRQQGIQIQNCKLIVNAPIRRDSYFEEVIEEQPITVSISKREQSKEDVFHFLRKLIQPNQKSTKHKQQEETNEDNFDQYRENLKQQSYYVRNSVAQIVHRQIDDNVIDRLYPKAQSVSKNYKERMQILKQMRMNVQSTQSLREHDILIKSTHHYKRPQQFNTKLQTFRQLFNSSSKKVQATSSTAVHSTHQKVQPFVECGIEVKKSRMKRIMHHLMQH